MNIRKKSSKVMGVGINDVDYPVMPRNSNGGQDICPYYARWKDMLRRCYINTEQLPTYEKVTHVAQWAYLSSFKSWMENQFWQGRHLDKDILSIGNKIYGPDTCVFVPQWLNSILVIPTKKRNLPLGVSDRGAGSKRFTANCSNVLKGSKFLGDFITPEEAHRAWQEAKCEALQDAILAYMYDQGYSQKVANSLHQRIEILVQHIEDGKETKSFT